MGQLPQQQGQQPQQQGQVVETTTTTVEVVSENPVGGSPAPQPVVTVAIPGQNQAGTGTSGFQDSSSSTTTPGPAGTGGLTPAAGVLVNPLPTGRFTASSAHVCTFHLRCTYTPRLYLLWVTRACEYL